jgi:2-dehydropantoate 2-reductase
VIVIVKAPAQTQVAEVIGPLLRPETRVAFVQNGIPWWYFDRHGGPLDGTRLSELDPGEAIRRAIGVERTLGGVVYAASSVIAPGVIELEAPTSKLVLGAPDGSIDAGLRALAGAIEAGGMACPPSDDIRTDILSKLVSNIANGPLCLLTRNHSKGTLGDPVIRAAAIRMGEEAEALARALGRPVRVPAAERIATIGKVDHKPSILQDLEAGRAMEIDAMFTVPLRIARLVGVPTPTLDLAIALAVQAARSAGLYPVSQGG